MNVREATKYLFVSRTHIRRLIERGDLVAHSSVDEDDTLIDAESLRAYRSRLEKAGKEYQQDKDEE